VVVKIIFRLPKVPRTHSLAAVPQLSCRIKLSLGASAQRGRCMEIILPGITDYQIACRYLLPRVTFAAEELCQLAAVMILDEVENVRIGYTGF